MKLSECPSGTYGRLGKMYGSDIGSPPEPTNQRHEQGSASWQRERERLVVRPVSDYILVTETFSIKVTIETPHHRSTNGMASHTGRIACGTSGVKCHVDFVGKFGASRTPRTMSKRVMNKRIVY